MSRFKRSQAKYVKQTPKITNWPAYDQALVTRGSLTFWFTDDPHQRRRGVSVANAVRSFVKRKRTDHLSTTRFQPNSCLVKGLG